MMSYASFEVPHVAKCQLCGDFYDSEELRNVVNRKTGKRQNLCPSCVWRVRTIPKLSELRGY